MKETTHLLIWGNPTLSLKVENKQLNQTIRRPLLYRTDCQLFTISKYFSLVLWYITFKGDLSWFGNPEQTEKQV